MDQGVIGRKLRVLADAAKYDASCASSGSKGRNGPGLGSTNGMGICHSYTPDGRCVSLLKILLTNRCTFDCSYCINRRSSDVERATFEVDEVVRLTMEFYRRNYIEGLFLSSGVLKNPDHTMERMVEVARRLRHSEGFCGYIHLKAVAGASGALVEQAGRVADRVSVNIELPTPADLGSLAPEKRVPEIHDSMGTLKGRIDEAEHARATARRANPPAFAPAGQSTQMIIGATPSADRDVLQTADGLYRRFALRRVYYSAYSPIPFADPLLPTKASPLVREHRLYQADWLLRFYGFGLDEITPHDAPQLDLQIDPKLAWALANRARFPVDLRTASREELLRVPGLGTRSVQRILASRGHAPITLDALARLRVPLRKVLPFVLTADPNPRPARLLDAASLRQHVIGATQLPLFAAS